MVPPSNEQLQFDDLYTGTLDLIARGDLTWGDVLDQILTDDPPLALGNLGILRRWLDEMEPELVAAVRQGGGSWFDIAKDLGVSRQAVWERYRGLDEAQLVTPDQLANQLGISPKTLRAWLRDQGYIRPEAVRGTRYGPLPARVTEAARGRWAKP